MMNTRHTGAYIDPDIAGLLVDNEGMDGVSEGLQALLSGLVLMCRDEERRRQQD